METNQKLIEAARLLVREHDPGDDSIEIPGYPNMFVAVSGGADIQEFQFFTENDKRYAVGPKTR